MDTISKLLLLLFALHALLPSTTAEGLCVADRSGLCSGSRREIILTTSDETSRPASQRPKDLAVDDWHTLANPGCAADSCDNVENRGANWCCRMSEPMLAVGDLNNDGLQDVVITSQHGGQGGEHSVPVVHYEILLLLNTGTVDEPSFTTVPRDATTPHVDPFIEVRGNTHRQGECDCANGPGGTCCDHFLRSDGFLFNTLVDNAPANYKGTSDAGSGNRDDIFLAHHGQALGAPVALATLVGGDDLLDLVIGRNLYKNIGTKTWPKYSEVNRIALPLMETEESQVAGANLPTSYHFHDFDADGDQDAVITTRGHTEGGAIHLLRNIGDQVTPSFTFWPGLDTQGGPFLKDSLEGGNDVIVADFDNDGLADILVGGDLLFTNRGSETPRFVNLGLGTKIFDKRVERTSLHMDSRVSPVLDFSAIGIEDGDTSTHLLSLLWVVPDFPTPILRYARPYLAFPTPKMLTRLPDQLAFDTTTSQYGRTYNDGDSVIGDLGDLNGDGLGDFISSKGALWLQQSVSSASDPLFVPGGSITLCSRPEDSFCVEGEANDDLNFAYELASAKPAACNEFRLEGLTFALADVNRDGKLDMVVTGRINAEPGWCLHKLAEDAEDGSNKNSPDLRLTYFQNTGTKTGPRFKRIRHGESLNGQSYPFGDAVFSALPSSHEGGKFGYAASMGDVNEDGWPDIIVTQQGDDSSRRAAGDGGLGICDHMPENRKHTCGDSMWGFLKLRYFVNNKDGTFGERTDVFPSNNDLYLSNMASSVATLNDQQFTSSQLVDWSGQGHADLFMNAGKAMMKGSYWLNKGDQESTQYEHIASAEASVGSCGGKKPLYFGETNVPLPGIVLFDPMQLRAYLLSDAAQTHRLHMDVFTALPRCELPNLPCGFGLCVEKVDDVPLGKKCNCPETYAGDSAGNQLLPAVFHAYCATCATGAVNVDAELGLCQVCPRGYFSNQTFAAWDPSARVPTTDCRACGAGRVGPAKMAPSAALCLECPAGKKSSTAVATTIAACSDCTPGKFSTAGSSSCTECDLGQYQDQAGQAGCQNCIFGKFQETRGQTCTKCDPGMYRDDHNNLICVDCPSGYFQDDDGSAICFPCIPGTFNDELGQQQCKDCEKDMYSEETEQLECTDCPTGTSTSNKTGRTMCISCISGKYGDSCTPCEVGYYRGPDDPAAVCLACDLGRFVNTPGSPSCFNCPAGTAAKKEGSSECSDCLAGSFRGREDNATTCISCPRGFYTIKKAQPFCLDCDAGRFAADEGTGKDCSACPSGRYEDDKRSNGPCKECEEVQGARRVPNPEKTGCIVPLADPKVSTTELLRIDASTVTGNADADGRRRRLSSNDVPQADATIAKLTVRIKRSSQGDASAPIVTDTDHIEVMASSRTDFMRARTILIAATDFEQIDEDKDTSPPQWIIVSILVSALATDTQNGNGNVNSNTAAATRGLWHDQMFFKVRVVKDANDESSGGEFSTRNDAWPTARNCDDSEYLSTKLDDGVKANGKPSKEAPLPLFSSSPGAKNTAPNCLPCPKGGNCEGDKTWDETTNLAGYRQLPWDPRAFGECPQPTACPAGDFKKANGSSASNGTEMIEMSCLEGHQGYMCSQCIVGYTIPLASGDETCIPCPEPNANKAAVGAVLALGGLVIAFLVYDSLDGINDIVKAVERNKKETDPFKAHAESQIPFHSVGIRIISSYLQVAALLRNFQVALPPSVKALATAQGSASGIGGQVISFACLSPNVRGPDLFFLKQIITTIVLPIMMALAVVVFWGLHALCCRCGKKEGKTKKKKNDKKGAEAEGKEEKGESSKSGMKITAKDKAIGSLVILFYLSFPSIMTSVTSMLQCTSYGPNSESDRGFSVETKILLDAELSIECYKEAHIAYMLGVALPGMLVFVFIIPLLLIFTMRHHSQRKELMPHQGKIFLGFVFINSAHFSPCSPFFYSCFFLFYFYQSTSSQPSHTSLDFYS